MRTEAPRGLCELALASLLVAATDASSLPPSMPEATSADEYVIYSVLLSESSWAGQRTVVVQKETVDDVGRASGEFEEVAERLKHEFVDVNSTAPLPDELIESFGRLRNEEAHIDGRGFLDSKVVVLRSEVIRKLFESGNFREGWTMLRERYKAGSIFTFSRVAFSEDRTRAMVAWSVNCGFLCGVGEYVLLGNVNGQWSIIARERVWIA